MKGVKAFKRVNGKLLTGGIGGSTETEWKVGETKEISDKPILCERGFHFFEEKNLCFGINYFKEFETVFCEVEALGDIVQDTFKVATNKLKVNRYIPKKEWKKLIDNKNNSGNNNSGNRNSGNRNSGNENSGYGNSGYGNSGNENSGNRNSGHCNSGDENSGYRNSGNGNSGNCNSGNMNSGYGNSGHRNSGNMNSGDWNSGDRNSGYKNSGYGNSGNRNSGHWNSGDENSGDENSGHCNSGNDNSGNDNSGNRNSGHRNSGNWNSGNGNSGNGNSGNGYINFFCEETRYFLFDIEVSEETIERVKQISMSWFDLKDKTYKEAWKLCPEEILEQFKEIKEFQTKEAKEKFQRITGLEI